MTWRERDRQPEMMDQVGLSPAAHRAALIGLRRLNRLSFAAHGLWRMIAAEARRAGSSPLRVLDLACGGGDVSVALAKHACRAHVALVIHGLDISELAVNVARQLAADQGAHNVTFELRDVLRESLHVDGNPDGRFDVVISSLFLHHLTEPDAVLLLARMKAAATRLVLVNDIRRTRFGRPLVTLASRLVTRSEIVHADGPLSAQAAFTLDELAELARCAGLNGCTIRRCWPQRMLLAWRPA